MREAYDVIVVGAGPNGLTAGAYLAKAGLKVLLLEKNPETGGGLVTQEVCGFRLNHHATYMLLSELMPPVEDLELKKWGIRFITPPVQMAFLFEDRSSLLFYTDKNESAKSIASFSREDAERFLTMWEEMEKIFHLFLLPATYYPPLDPLTQTEKLQNSDPLGKKIAEISEMTAGEVLDHYGLKHPKVRGALLYTVSMFGLEPDEALGFLVPIYILRVLSSSLLCGGSHFLASVLRTVVETNGGAVRTSVDVERFYLEGERVSGVVLKDGTVLKARAVISTLNPEQTFLHLLPAFPKKEWEDLKDMAQRWEWEPVSLFIVHRAIAGPKPTYPGYPSSVNDALYVVMGYESEEDVFTHFQEVREGKFSPKGHGTIPSRFDPLSIPRHIQGVDHSLFRFETWAPYEYEWSLKKKKEIAKLCMERWGEYCPALREGSIIVEIAWSPQDIEEHNAAMKRGSIKHGAYLPLQMGYNRPGPECSSYGTPIPGLYLGGASTHPGGMVILGGGYNSARKVCEDLGVPFPANLPPMISKAIERGYL